MLRKSGLVADLAKAPKNKEHCYVGLAEKLHKTNLDALVVQKCCFGGWLTKQAL